MANPKKRVAQNVEGDFFVDSTCIDCDACRQIAPAVFAQGEETSFVRAQPATPADRRSALHALLSCPTGSIGNLAHDDLHDATADFPLEVEHPVYYCGYNSPRSYGGNSYFIRHVDGNWLIDSPKFVPAIVRRLEELGGVAHIFLTHRDDVADAARYARHFRARRILHYDELAAQPESELILNGEGPWKLGEDFLAIGTPGHTRGHCALLFQDRFLFTGDHLDWDREEQRLYASKSYCWHSWEEQTESMARLAAYDFEWVLPGHGQRVHLPNATMRQELLLLVEWMERRR